MKYGLFFLLALSLTAIFTACDDAGTEPKTDPPAKPDIKTMTAGNGFVTVKWDLVENAASYTVYIDTIQGVSSESNAISGITADSLKQSGLFNGTTYYFRVAAVNSEGLSSDLSEEKSAEPKTDSLAAPAITVIKADGTSIHLTWSVVNGASHYVVYWDTAAGITMQSNRIPDVTQLSYNHTGLSFGKNYYYRIAAKDAGGKTSALSDEASANIKFSLYVSTTPGDGMITLAWKAVENAKSYDVYWDTVKTVDTLSNVFTGVTKEKYTHTGLINGKAYFYAVGVNIGDEKWLSSVVSVTPDSSGGGKTGTTCTKEGEKSTIEGKSVVCKGGIWVYTGGDKTGGKSCTEGEVYVGKGSKWVCTNGQWVEQ